MDNAKAISYREKIPKINNFDIRQLRNMPKYFGWVSYSVNKKDKIFLFLGGHDDGVALRCFWNNHYEKKTLEIWSLLSNVEGIILDIGAHTGIYSLIANKFLKKGAVLSFEPHFLNFSRLNLNLRANEFSTSTIFMNAVGEKNELLPFSVSKNLDMLTSGGRIGKVTNQISKPIQTIAIDTFLDDVGKNNVKLIKIDVEGYEYKCFLGMTKTLIASRPIIFFECVTKNYNSEIYLFLKNHGYKIFIVDDIEGLLIETNEVLPILDQNQMIIHQKINRIAIPKDKVDLLKVILEK